jgi:hypothetical protein
VTINVNAIKDFMELPVPLALRAEYSDTVSMLTKSTRLLPDTSIERDRKVLNDNEDF